MRKYAASERATRRGEHVTSNMLHLCWEGEGTTGESTTASEHGCERADRALALSSSCVEQLSFAR